VRQRVTHSFGRCAHFGRDVNFAGAFAQSNRVLAVAGRRAQASIPHELRVVRKPRVEYFRIENAKTLRQQLVFHFLQLELVQVVFHVWIAQLFVVELRRQRLNKCQRRFLARWTLAKTLRRFY
jgi:hypothetical protein